MVCVGRGEGGLSHGDPRPKLAPCQVCKSKPGIGRVDAGEGHALTALYGQQDCSLVL